MWGGVELGGGHVVCAIGAGADSIDALEEFPTLGPPATIAEITRFFRSRVGGTGRHLEGIGIASFGPIDRVGGRITKTPKPGWSGTQIVQPLRQAMGCPVIFETDVNAAAIAEARWGAARSHGTVAYITIGTGIGVGIVLDGLPHHGLGHPEFGHQRIPHDPARDPFDGACPFHGDCWEGLASGAAIAARWSAPAHELAGREDVWSLESHYVGLGVANVVLAWSPGCVVIGGGVSRHSGLIEAVRAEVDRTMAGYPETAAPDRPGAVIVQPGLGERSGVLGALAIARLPRTSRRA